MQASRETILSQFYQFRDEIYQEITPSNDDGYNYYIENIKVTFKHLEDIIRIKYRIPCNTMEHYDINDIENLNLPDIRTIATIEYTYYDENRACKYRSLNRWLALYSDFKKHSRFMQS
ncbi:MAG TPA: hypothetical protein VHD33_07815, partial [Legionellaceae bacterium]|nr:hypothetical protein [Legionellaceae bacterium]